MLSAIKITTMTILLSHMTLAQHPSASQFPPGALGTYTSAQLHNSVQQATTPKPYFPPAQVHYVNIGEDLAGDYKFGYDTGKSGAGQSFREESRLPDGTVKGAYGYIDAEGKQRIVKYTAGIEGFKVESDEEAPRQGSSSPSYSTPAPATAPVRTYSPSPPQSQSVVQPQTITIRSFAPQPQLQPVAVRTYPAAPAPTLATTPASTPVQLPPPQPSYRITVSTPTTQSLSGYTSVAHTTGVGQPQYVSALPAQPQSQSQPAIVATGNQYSTTSLSSYEPASIPATHIRPVSIHTSGTQQPQARSATPITLAAILAQVRSSSSQGATSAAAHHLASIPRATSSLSGSPYTPGSAFGQPAQAEQEVTTWGPPVINKELLSYNIGVQQG